MIALELHPRIIENKDWATIVFVATFALIVLAKSAFENRFYDFMRVQGIAVKFNCKPSKMKTAAQLPIKGFPTTQLKNKEREYP